MMKNNAQKAKSYLKIIRIQFLLIFFTGLIFGVVASNLKDSSDHNTVIIGEWIYIIYEFGIRTLTTWIAFYYTIKYIKIKKKTLGKLRKYNFISLSISALVYFVILPIIFMNSQLYYSFMPFPWHTFPFQASYNGAFMTTDLNGGLNPSQNGAVWAFMIYNAYQVIVFIGTLFVGRRWQCSMLCGMAGGHAEAFGEVLPLTPHNKKRKRSKQINPLILKILKILKITQFLLAICLSIIWALILSNVEINISIDVLITIELLNYYIFALMLMSLGWCFIGGRAYCLYCPAGTMMGLIGKQIGQRIETNLTNCIDCGQCNDACKMSIDIRSLAVEGLPVITINCVGCGACIDACPTKNLKYTTNFIEYLHKKKNKL